jgi:hypothetical protein
MKVKFFDDSTTTSNELNKFVEDKVINDVTTIGGGRFIIIKYAEQKIVQVDCTKLNTTEAKQFLNLLKKVKFKNDKDVIIDCRYGE